MASHCMKESWSGLQTHDIAGVTVYRGILGYGANRRIHKDAALSLSHDRPILLFGG